MPPDTPAHNDASIPPVQSPGEHASAMFSREFIETARGAAVGQGRAPDAITLTAGGNGTSIQFTPLDYGQTHRQRVAAAIGGSTAPGASTADRTAQPGRPVADIVALNDSTKGPASTGNAGHDLSSVAQSLQGQQLWRQSKYADTTQAGKFGCAASTSLALEKAGFKYVDAPTVGGLVGQLHQHGWTKHPASEAQQNDVMVAYNRGTNWQKGGGNAHVGVVAAGGQVYNNSARQGATWAAEDPDVAFGHYDSRYVLRR